MKLQDQVCSIEQAKTLKELGVEQDSIFYYDARYDEPSLFMPSYWSYRKRGILVEEKEATADLRQKGLLIAAFTVAELGVMLPPGYETMYCTNDGWRGFDLDGKDMCDSATYDTEAHARAEMLIHLLLTKAITAAEVNGRLNS